MLLVTRRAEQTQVKSLDCGIDEGTTGNIKRREYADFGKSTYTRGVGCLILPTLLMLKSYDVQAAKTPPPLKWMLL